MTEAPNPVTLNQDPTAGLEGVVAAVTSLALALVLVIIFDNIIQNPDFQSARVALERVELLFQLVLANDEAG